jgi:hypothetical protein
MIYAQGMFSNLPVAVLFIPEGQFVAFTVMAPFVPFYDADPEFPAVFDALGFQISGGNYNYDTLYRCKEATDVVQWLNRQQVEITGFGNAN